jgi:hypothetical protein
MTLRSWPPTLIGTPAEARTPWQVVMPAEDLWESNELHLWLPSFSCGRADGT